MSFLRLVGDMAGTFVLACEGWKKGIEDGRALAWHWALIENGACPKHFFLSPCQTHGSQAGNPFNHRVLAAQFTSFSLEYDTILEDIASTDVVKSEWPKLRDIIKAKLEKNILFFLSTTQQPERPAPFHPTPLITGGLKLPPFPPRKLNQLLHANDVPVSYMNEQQANELKGHIFVQLDEFDLDNPPFTIQRLCELCIHPRRNYNSVGKYLRAVEKSILVTSTQDSFPPLTEAELDSSGRSAIALGSTRQSAPSTPLFSPIPFLHDDARRSKSRSPPPTPLTLGPSLDGPETKALGLVDELDDPSPGHLSEHPTALTSTTTVSKDAPPHSRPFLGSLEQRFVKSEDVDGNNASTVQGDSNSMILDDDKENTKS